MAGGAAPLVSTGMFKSGFKLMPRHYVYPFALVTSLFFLWGFAYGLLDVLNKHFQNVLGISKVKSTGLQVAYFGLGYFCFAPVAGEVMRRRGYKVTILMGLSLYSFGAIMFWPTAKFSGKGNPNAVFAGFVICTAVIAAGLASLETAANSYITVMPPTNQGALRLQISQSFNGVASFIGPFIASHYFFTGKNKDNLDNVQWVYLAVSLMGVSIAVLFFFQRLPEVSEADLQAEANALAAGLGAVDEEDVQLAKPFWKQTRPIFGFAAQFSYVGAQVTIGTFMLNFLEDHGYSDAAGSNMLSYCLITFTVFRFVSAALLTVIPAEFLLLVVASLSAIFVAVMSSVRSVGGVVAAFFVYAAMASQFPVIFVLSTQRMGRHTRRASSLIISAIVGGAVFPVIQGAIADKWDTIVSMWLSFPAFIIVAAYAFWLWSKQGFLLTRAAERRHADGLAVQHTTAELGGGLDGKTSAELEVDSDKEKHKTATTAHVERV